MLENFDHARGPGGSPVYVTGARALIQRLLIRLCVKKGSFLPDPSLGSELYKLTETPPPKRGRLALHLAQEALLPEGVVVKSASCKIKNGDILSIHLSIEADGKRYPLEVAVC